MYRGNIAPARRHPYAASTSCHRAFREDNRGRDIVEAGFSDIKDHELAGRHAHIGGAKSQTPYDDRRMILCPNCCIARRGDDHLRWIDAAVVATLEGIRPVNLHPMVKVADDIH